MSVVILPQCRGPDQSCLAAKVISIPTACSAEKNFLSQLGWLRPTRKKPKAKQKRWCKTRHLFFFFCCFSIRNWRQGELGWRFGCLGKKLSLISRVRAWEKLGDVPALFPSPAAMPRWSTPSSLLKDVKQNEISSSLIHFPSSQPAFPSLISPAALCRKEGALLCYSHGTKRGRYWEYKASPGDPGLGRAHPAAASWFWVAPWSFHVSSLPVVCHF